MSITNPEQPEQKNQHLGHRMVDRLKKSDTLKVSRSQICGSLGHSHSQTVSTEPYVQVRELYSEGFEPEGFEIWGGLS